ncbi:hypothetical protein ABK040_009487 [Willaertia magna]
MNLTKLIINKWKNNEFSTICLQNLQQLQHLEMIDTNKLRFKEFKNLINLKHLTIIKSYVDSFYSFLGDFINLETLKIDGLHFEEGCFTNIKKLKKLKLIGTSIDNNCFYKMTNLEELHCSLNLITDLNILKYLKKLKLHSNG